MNAQHCGTIPYFNNKLLNFQFKAFFLWSLSHASELFGKHMAKVTILFFNFFWPGLSHFFKKHFVTCTLNSFSWKSSFFCACLARLFFTNFYNYVFFFFFFYEYIFTVENKKTKKDIHEASRHLRMPGRNLKTIKFNNI